ncbi:MULTISPECIES: hypothetical protein [unclassified Oceanispirochaeta]|uniref:hypothetical protein n=1 Tax=unclassified Oceanispirochaeta TaxID=2635722 RepID=UPI000E091DF0|nr:MULTISPECIES: hypothetical protein [unclassified Oceanispirochaeta]MBF9016343.1 hypothetical protein [Oceanispirochaeta sp. M2]NPD72805.1 hypothetical protein [Oceanispirochaeta sp. M1]RDG31649.1 hypothetical protein DV872_11905 [Oceanispirochaeta sp. M1]
MTFQEKRSLGLLISNVAVSAIYYLIVYNKFQAGELGSLGDTRMWAAIILLSIPIYIAANILMMIMVNIIQAIATQEEPKDIVDEMDKLIELKATRNFYHTFMVGFMLALGSQYLRMEIHVMFIILITTLVLAGIVNEISQLYFYRKGV